MTDNRAFIMKNQFWCIPQKEDDQLTVWASNKMAILTAYYRGESTPARPDNTPDRLLIGDIET